MSTSSPTTQKMRALVVAGTALALISGCATTTEAAGPGTSSPQVSASATVAATAGCLVEAPAPTYVDDVFDYLLRNETDPVLQGTTVVPLCAADVDSTFADPETSAQFFDMAAGEISKDGNPYMKVVAGQLNSGDGVAFSRTFMTDVRSAASQASPPTVVTTEARSQGGHVWTQFTDPADTRGFVYAHGPVVVIASVVPGVRTDLPGTAFSEILTAVGVTDLDGDHPLAQGRYTVASDDGWVYFRTFRKGDVFNSCGIGPDGSAGCDLVPRCFNSDVPERCVGDAPLGMNEVIVTEHGPASFRRSDPPAFLRDVDSVPDGHQVEHNGTRCRMGFQGSVTCETTGGTHGFRVSSASGTLW